MKFNKVLLKTKLKASAVHLGIKLITARLDKLFTDLNLFFYQLLSDVVNRLTQLYNSIS